jgi:NAD(P)-dependent dehydrogenase (short-subunit alcohol dehydrogenase family)
VSDALRVEVASAGIDVVLVEPGGFRTNIWTEMDASVAGRKGSRYESAYRRSLASLKYAEPLMGAPDAVARVIVRALAARRPRPRYLVGYDAQLLALAEPVLPTSVKDLVSRLTLGL